MTTKRQQAEDFLNGKQIDPRDKTLDVFLTPQQINSQAGVFLSGPPLNKSADVFIDGVVPQHDSAKDFLG